MLNWLTRLFASASKASQTLPAAILIPIGIPPTGGVSAALAEALKLVNCGAIHRISFGVPRFYPKNLISKEVREVNPKDTWQMLKAIFELENVHFSVVSKRRDRILISASYLNETTGSARLPPLLNGAVKPFVPPIFDGPDDFPPLPPTG